MDAATFTEAPASVTVKFVLDGFDTMLTLRAETGQDVLRKLQGAMNALAEMGATPTNGHSANGKTASNGDEPQMCPIHGVVMQRHEKGSQTWYSHKTPDGSWCRGK